MPHPRCLFLYSRFFKQLTVIAHDWIRTMDLWHRKWPLCQLSHSDCPLMDGINKSEQLFNCRYYFLKGVPLKDGIYNQSNCSIFLIWSVCWRIGTIIAARSITSKNLSYISSIWIPFEQFPCQMSFKSSHRPWLVSILHSSLEKTRDRQFTDSTSQLTVVNVIKLLCRKSTFSLNLKL